MSGEIANEYVISTSSLLQDILHAKAEKVAEIKNGTINTNYQPLSASLLQQILDDKNKKIAEILTVREAEEAKSEKESWDLYEIMTKGLNKTLDGGYYLAGIANDNVLSPIVSGAQYARDTFNELSWEGKAAVVIAGVALVAVGGYGIYMLTAVPADVVASPLVEAVVTSPLVEAVIPKVAVDYDLLIAEARLAEGKILNKITDDLTGSFLERGAKISGAIHNIYIKLEAHESADAIKEYVDSFPKYVADYIHDNMEVLEGYLHPHA